MAFVNRYEYVYRLPNNLIAAPTKHYLHLLVRERNDAPFINHQSSVGRELK